MSPMSTRRWAVLRVAECNGAELFDGRATCAVSRLSLTTQMAVVPLPVLPVCRDRWSTLEGLLGEHPHIAGGCDAA